MIRISDWRNAPRAGLAETAEAWRWGSLWRRECGQSAECRWLCDSPPPVPRNWQEVEEFAGKVEAALESGIHVVLVDLFPPGPHDPQGMQGAIWERLNDEAYCLPPDESLTLASYVAEFLPNLPKIYVEHLAVGLPLVDMPLFLNPDRYVNLPLEATYAAAYRGMPSFWRDVLEGK